MLYASWRQVAGRNAREIALWEVATNRRWTFGELAAEVESGANFEPPIVFPREGSADFIFRVLRAWRSGSVVCALEPDRSPPEMDVDLPKEVVHLKTTSATTGEPRLVAVTAGQLQADAANIVLTMGLRPEWPNLGVISLAHSYGFSNLVLPMLLHGIPLALVGSTLPEALRQAAAGHESVTLAAVPALWRAWQDAHAIPTNVRLAISAGAGLPLALEQQIYAERRLKLHNFYGSSECGGIAYDGSETARADPALAGAPLSGVTVTAADDGCLEVRSKAVALTYWPEKDSNLAHGVFRTSDLGEVSGGRVYLRGRAGDQINVAGRKVIPEIIERIVAAHPHVRQCLAFGVPSTDDQRGETIVACVAASPEVSRDSLKQFAMARLPAWQVPREWWLVDSVETNERGKLSRAEWRRRYLETGKRVRG